MRRAWETIQSHADVQAVHKQQGKWQDTWNAYVKKNSAFEAKLKQALEDECDELSSYWGELFTCAYKELCGTVHSKLVPNDVKTIPLRRNTMSCEYGVVVRLLLEQFT